MDAMKPILHLTLFLFLSIPFLSQAQENGASREGSTNCYRKYMRGFERRGAKNVENGTHENVVITVRKGNSAECYIGKAKVRDGLVTEAHIMAADSSYEKMDYDYKHEEVDFEIVNGVAGPKVTDDQEKLVNVLFVKHIKPKPKKYMRAPEPDFD